MLMLLLVAGCSQPDPTTRNAGSPGDKLEASATARGLVPDPSASIVGAWARDTDRVCVVPGGADREMLIGALVDYGEGQGCAATGTVTRSGGHLNIRFGACRMTATFDGARIVFPAEVPATCDQLCIGRASLAALAVDRQSDSVSEAATLKTPGGRSLCAG